MTRVGDVWGARLKVGRQDVGGRIRPRGWL